MNDSPGLFTAARIASALGRDKRGLLRVLRRASCQGKIVVPSGQWADVWSIESLPADYRADLERLAKLKGCRSAAHLLEAGMVRWKPSIPLPELDQRHVTKAVRVKNALARAIALHMDPRSSVGEIRRNAWADYQKEFGVVSERTVRRIFDRVIERDGGEEKYDDIALYLDEKLSRARGKEPVIAELLGPHEHEVFGYLNAVQRPAEPTIHELDLIWFAACKSMDTQVAEGTPLRKCRHVMIALLERSAVNLSKNRDALKKLLKRKHSRFVECSGDFNRMIDQRSETSGWKRALALPEKERLLIVGHAAQNKGGRLAPALRELRDSGELSAELEMHHLSNPASKSYVPKSIRAQVQPDVRRLKNMVHGPRTHALLGAHITRDYSSMAAGDWFQADDVTLPVYYFELTENGPGLMRGQFLVMIDVRTDFILGFLLISERNYDSLAIRSLITLCASKHGLPRRGFYFERGIWKSSRIISGSQNPVPLEHADRGLRSLGMDLRHARLPRGKVIERTIGQLQDRMEGFVGYVGRDERHDVRERVQRSFLDAKAGRKPMNEVALSKDEYCERLAEIVEKHNAEPQQGIRLNGLSPVQAWEGWQSDEPRQGFEQRWRYVLARDVRKIKVGRNGITLRYGKKTFVYHGAETGKRVGEEVLAWFDPMMPDVLACTDLNHRNLFCIERANDISAMDEPDEMLRDEMRKVAEHQDYAKTLYWTSRNVLKEHHYIATIADADTVKMGTEIAFQSERLIARKEEQVKRTRANRALIERENLPRELLQNAEARSPEALNALSRLLSETEETP
jgi:hypothetical protein